MVKYNTTTVKDPATFNLIKNLNMFTVGNIVGSNSMRRILSWLDENVGLKDGTEVYIIPGNNFTAYIGVPLYNIVPGESYVLALSPTCFKNESWQLKSVKDKFKAEVGFRYCTFNEFIKSLD